MEKHKTTEDDDSNSEPPPPTFFEALKLKNSDFSFRLETTSSQIPANNSNAHQELREDPLPSYLDAIGISSEERQQMNPAEQLEWTMKKKKKDDEENRIMTWVDSTHGHLQGSNRNTTVPDTYFTIIDIPASRVPPTISNNFGNSRRSLLTPPIDCANRFACGNISVSTESVSDESHRFTAVIIIAIIELILVSALIARWDEFKNPYLVIILLGAGSLPLCGFLPRLNYFHN